MGWDGLSVVVKSDSFFRQIRRDKCRFWVHRVAADRVDGDSAAACVLLRARSYDVRGYHHPH